MAESKFDGIAKFLHTAGSVLLLIAIVFFLLFCRAPEGMEELSDALKMRRAIAYGVGGLGSMLVILAFLSGMLSGMSQTTKRPPGQPAPPQQNPPGTPPKSER